MSFSTADTRPQSLCHSFIAL